MFQIPYITPDYPTERESLIDMAESLDRIADLLERIVNDLERHKRKQTGRKNK